MMKKRLRFWIAAVLAALMLFSLVACTGEDYTPTETAEAAVSSTALEAKVASSQTELPPSEAPPEAESAASEAAASSDEELLDPDGTYTTKEDVSLYLYTYGELPSNFITKKEAQALGWSGGSLEPYAPGKCIGGDRFGNYEGILPEDHTYHECDINTLGASRRGAERLVYSDDGLIYYTEDHYETFTLLYGEE